MEVAAHALAAENDDDRRQDHHDCGDARQRRRVAESFREDRLADGGSRRHQHTELIRKPGKNPAEVRGDSSKMCAGITPQAPCTKNCIRNTPDQKRQSWRVIHSGMTSAADRRVIIVRRRPKRSE